MDDLDDFMSEVEHNENVQMPKQFDDVVDIVVPKKGGARFTRDGKTMIGFLEP